MDKWSALQFFVATVDSGSFAEAARLFGTAPSTVSKAVARLEQELGVILLQRSTRKLNLTEAGRHYAYAAKHAMSALSEREQEIKNLNNAPEGTLRINVPVSYGRLYITPLVASFVAKYPSIHVELHFNDSYVDIIEHGFDLAIRSGRVKDSQLIVRQLSVMDFITCASSSFADSLPAHFSEQVYADYPWIRFRFQQTGKLMPVMVKQDDEVIEVDPNRFFVVDDGEAMLQLCADNLGLTQVPHFIAHDAIRSGKVVPLLPHIEMKDFGVFVIYPKRDFLPKKTALFIEHLVEAIEQRGESSTTTWARTLAPYFSQTPVESQ